MLHLFFVCGIDRDNSAPLFMKRRYICRIAQNGVHYFITVVTPSLGEEIGTSTKIQPVRKIFENRRPQSTYLFLM
jgi:hypothetical protein